MATSSPRRSRSSAASAAPRAASTRSRSAASAASAAGSQATGNGTSRRAGLYDSAASARPLVGQRGQELQAFGTIARLPIGLSEKVCLESVQALNQVLADTMTLRDMYKKHHWQVAGETFYQLHLLFDKHYEAQSELVDLVAERIQVLGGISLAMAHDVAEATGIERPPRGREEVPVQLSRLLEGHEHVLREARRFAKAADERGDDGTNDLLVSDVIRTNELQVWFIAEHLVDAPLVRAEED
jgi:starvation-inducible DNA-binding protein